MLGGNLSGRSAAPLYAPQQGFLRLSRVPAGQEALLGQTLIGAGALGAGTWECVIATDRLGAVDITLMPSALVGATPFAPTGNILRANGAASRSAVAGANFSAGVSQIVALASLKGATRCTVTFTVPAAHSITFDEGSNKASPTAIAEYNGQ